MDFSPIPPIALREKYLKMCSTWFALAQEDYYFYETRPSGTTLILDNGAYEGKIDFERFRSAIFALKPTVVVLPDLLLQETKCSFYLSMGFLEQYEQEHAVYDHEWMFVPQARPDDVEGFVESAYAALKDERITWIGVPRCFVTDIAKNPLARVLFVKALKKDFPLIKIHALGMINGCIPELYYLQKEGVLSCDSSWPFNNGDIESNLRRIDECLSML